MDPERRTTVERSRRRFRRLARAAQRRLSESTSLVEPPAVDHVRRNDAFGDARRLGVLHIPKSAGSSVSAALRAALSDRSWSPYDLDRRLFGPMRDEPVPMRDVPRVLPDPERLRDHDAASGHFALSTMLVGFDPADIVMLLREPRTRLLSNYEFWRGLPADRSDEDSTWSVTAYARELDFDEWLVDARSAYQTDNVVLRTLLDDDPAIPDDDFLDPADLAVLTARAVRRAASLGWVDVVERGPAMWDGLADRIARPLDRPEVNATERRADLPTNVSAIFSDRSVDALHHRTVADRAIWAAAARRRGIDDVTLLAERAWYRRLSATLDAQSEPGSALSQSD